MFRTKNVVFVTSLVAILALAALVLSCSRLPTSENLTAAPKAVEQKTGQIAPFVTTIGAYPTAPTWALLWASLDNMGTASSVEVYFQWGETDSYGFETMDQPLTSNPKPPIIYGLASLLIPDTSYHVRVVAEGDGTSYGQDKVIKTVPMPTVTVVSPNGGESWVAGTSQTISWTYVGATKNVWIELIKGDIIDQMISRSAPIGIDGKGSFSWVIPSTLTAGADYKIKIMGVAEPECTDTSDYTFTITNQ